MKLLIIGKNGQLGWDLVKKARERRWVPSGLDLPEFDITDEICVNSRLNEPGIDIVINAAAYTAVDLAEKERDKAYAVNCTGPALLAKACQRHDLPLIHISTDYVFDGMKKSPYLETDPICPVGVYGQTKAEGEAAVRDTLKKHIIIRTAWLCGVFGSNFVKTMLKLGQSKRELRVVDDQFGCPTFAFDLAEAILDISQKISDGGDVQWGIYHYCGEGYASWYAFAQKIFDIASAFEDLSVERIIPIPTTEYPTPADRPAYSVLDCTKIKTNFDISTKPWQESLEKMIKSIFS